MTGTYLSAQTTTPPPPAAGENLFYFKADGNMYMLDSTGNETSMAAGKGSPSGALMQYIYNQFGGM